MDSIEKELQNNIRMAEQGRKIWLNLNEKYKFSRNDYVVLIPSLDEICNYYAIYYLDEFSKLRKAERIFILTYDENVIKEIETKMKSKNKDGIKDEDECEREVIYKVVDFSRESAVCLMKLYSLYKFTNNLIIASLTEPDGRSGDKLLEKYDLTPGELIGIGLYGINKIKNPNFFRE